LLFSLSYKTLPLSFVFSHPTACIRHESVGLLLVSLALELVSHALE
jgi:hypothetical protein